MTAYTISKNEQFNSLEISFDGKPSEAIREALKAMRFRWHGVKKVWYGYKTEEEVRAALDGEDTEPKATTTKASKTANKFGVKVGDLFYASWGYEQTNVDFFQVLELVGDSSVRVCEVDPPMIEEDAVGPMAADRTYKTSGIGILPAKSYSVFIKDQEKGDIKRLKSYAADGKSNPQFKISSYADARYCGEQVKTYESWYY